MVGLIFVAACVLFVVAYRYYGAFLNREFEVDEARPTPACTQHDGVDYVATNPWMLFGHHFSSIAGAGPIVGPILAASFFGWAPTLAWIILGSILIGGVHDFSSLMMSIRHRAHSIAEICRLYLTPVTYRCFLLFIWMCLVYVLIVFLDLTASTFIAAPASDPHQGATVASASVMYIVLAVIFGALVRTGRLSLKNGSFIFVPLVFLALFAARHFGISPDSVPAFLRDSPKYTWSMVLIVYCFVASISPVWVLLQPRDYLSSFLLVGCLVGGGLGLLLGSAMGELPIAFAAWRGWQPEGVPGPIFPILFITVACGACSGFHSIVSSGTTAKQLPSERAARPITYGGMLVEGALAVIAMATLMVLPAKPAAPVTLIFADGVGRFLDVFGIPAQLGSAFGLLAISTFLLTTLDTCTRLSRYLVEEFFSFEGTHWRYLSTIISLAPLFYFAFAEYPQLGPTGEVVGRLPAWKVIWPAFGTTNQLLAALALLVVVVWRKTQNKKLWFVFWPMLFMLATTVTSMLTLIAHHFAPGGNRAIAWIMIVMTAMTVLLVLDILFNWRNLGVKANVVE